MKNLFTITESEKERILGLHEQSVGYPANPNTGNKLGDIKTPNLNFTSSLTPEQQKLNDAANSWVESNKASIPVTVAEITKFLNDKVTAKQLTPESLPYIKARIQTNSNGTLVFSKEELDIQPKTSQPGVPQSGVPQTISSKVKSPKVEQLQTLLVTKYQKILGTSGVNKNGVDGFLGPKTITALKEVLATKQQKVETPKVDTPKVETPSNGTQPPANGTQPSASGTPSAPANAEVSNFDMSKFS